MLTASEKVNHNAPRKSKVNGEVDTLPEENYDSGNTNFNEHEYYTNLVHHFDQKSGFPAKYLRYGHITSVIYYSCKSNKASDAFDLENIQHRLCTCTEK